MTSDCMWSHRVLERTLLMSHDNVPSGSMWSCQVFGKTPLMSRWHWCALSSYVILSSIWKNFPNIVASMCPQGVRDLVEYLKELHSCCGVHVPSASMWSCGVFEGTLLILRCQCSLRMYVILLSIWKNSTHVATSMCPQAVCDLVDYLKEPHSCCGFNVPPGSTWSCRVFEKTPLMLWCQCSLSEYVILSSIWKNSTNVVVSIWPQYVRDLIQYLREHH
jgi:hypothetical protein